MAWISNKEFTIRLTFRSFLADDPAAARESSGRIHTNNSPLRIFLEILCHIVQYFLRNEFDNEQVFDCSSRLFTPGEN